MKTIGEKIKFFRELNNYTQEHVASLLEISQSTYSKWEKNEVNLTVHHLERIAGIYGHTPQFIQDFDPNRFIRDTHTPDIHDVIQMYQNHIHLLEQEREKLLLLLDKLIERLSP